MAFHFSHGESQIFTLTCKAHCDLSYQLLFFPPDCPLPDPNTGGLLLQVSMLAVLLAWTAPFLLPSPFLKVTLQSPSLNFPFSLSFCFSLLSIITQHDTCVTPLFCLWSIFPLKYMFHEGRGFHLFMTAVFPAPTVGLAQCPHSVSLCLIS